MDKIILPKKDDKEFQYLSYSQISTWKRSKRDYIRQYFFGESFDGSAYTDFGSKVGEALENKDFSLFTPLEQQFLDLIPRYDEFEREVKLKFNDFYVIGYVDTSSSDGLKIADYKTGNISKKKSDYDSDDYIQLDIYAGALEQETGLLPKDVKVILIGREGNAFKGEELILTGDYIEIPKKVTKKRVAEVKKDIESVAKEISDYYKVYLKLRGDEQDKQKT